MDINKITKVYVSIRDARSELKKRFDEEDKKLKEKLGLLEAELLKFLQANTTNSVKTDFGTVFRQEDMTPSASDWEAIYRWIQENEAFDMLERRIKKTFIKEYMDAHDGAIPPGVSVYREYAVRVRRS